MIIFLRASVNRCLFLLNFDTPFDTPNCAKIDQNRPNDLLENEKEKSPETLINTGLVGLFGVAGAPRLELGTRGFGVHQTTLMWWAFAGFLTPLLTPLPKIYESNNPEGIKSFGVVLLRIETCCFHHFFVAENP